MSTQELGKFPERDVKNAQRRRILPDLDLNNPPPDESTTPADISFNFNSQQCPPEACQGYQEESRSIEIIDDDVAIIDQSMFDEAKNNYRRNQSQVIDGLKDVPNEAGGLLNSLSGSKTANWYCKQRRDPMDEVITSRYLSMMEEASNRDKEKNVVKPVEFSKNPEPEAPSFICPICIGPMSMATTTKCGHVFCQECIKKAIAAQGKCPTCRKKLGKRGIIRVFLPTTN
ncbi:E3 ubiquitin-protein ligase complex slx8-rfp subunit slx8-like isoform X1 [Pistacia vera]|uniref:E3 ubiquitin-protein ligase complex slx8-rfp subunit slx8-like isoform X1 n=1 Tax=Pistacia vera TaxID=55513 RepID=UPI0012638EAB|nr:E3 ubiquitin-protein ligase complex slx8-rfp subunit slx8-like isoform X1 [Pistacia vera]